MYQRLHKVRSDRGVSQTDLAEATGVSQSVISKIERGALRSPGSGSWKPWQNILSVLLQTLSTIQNDKRSRLLYLSDSRTTCHSLRQTCRCWD